MFLVKKKLGQQANQPNLVIHFYNLKQIQRKASKGTAQIALPSYRLSTYFLVDWQLPALQIYNQFVYRISIYYTIFFIPEFYFFLSPLTLLLNSFRSFLLCYPHNLKTAVLHRVCTTLTIYYFHHLNSCLSFLFKLHTYAACASILNN